MANLHAVEELAFRIIIAGTAAYEDMIALRMNVLLDPIGIPRSYINPEKEKEDLLLGAYHNERLIGCCILTKVTGTVVQLRQMAIDASVQQKGVGALLLRYAERIAVEKGYTTLIMHARNAVLGFYKKSGYAIDGEEFFEVGIGHHRMKKMLTPTGEE